jgi:hypothetical protein
MSHQFKGALLRGVALSVAVAGVMSFSASAFAALPPADEAKATALASTFEADAQTIIAQDAGKSADQVTTDLTAAFEAAILASGATPDVAREALHKAQVIVQGNQQEWRVAGVPESFGRVQGLIGRTTQTGAGPGAGNGGNAGLGPAGGGAVGGGSGYRGS